MSETGESNASIGKSNFCGIRQNECDALDRDAHKSILDEIDGDRSKGEKGNWKGTLSRLFKNKMTLEGHEDGSKSEDGVSRKTSSLGKMFRRASSDLKKDSGEKRESKAHEGEGEKRPRRSKGLSKLLKKWPFKSDSQQSTESASVQPTSSLGTVEN